MRIKLEPKVVALSKKMIDSDNYIMLPEKIIAHDLIEDFRSKNKQLPSSIQQFEDKYNFYLGKCSLSVMTSDGARGVKYLHIKGKIVDGNLNPIHIDDGAPKTDWVKGNSKTNITFSLDFASLSKLAFIPLSDMIKGEISWKWNSNPQVAKIIFNNAGSTIGWKFSASDGKYVDGEHQIYFLMRVPKNTSGLQFQLSEAKADVDYKFKTDIMYYKTPPLNIPIETPPRHE